MSRQDINREVSAENVRRYVEHITTAIPSRLAGSPNARRMAEYSLQALHEAGAEARIQELPGLVSFPKKAELRIVAPREVSIEANTLGHSVRRRTAGKPAGRRQTGETFLSELDVAAVQFDQNGVPPVLQCGIVSSRN